MKKKGESNEKTESDKRRGRERKGVMEEDKRSDSERKGVTQRDRDIDRVSKMVGKRETERYGSKDKKRVRIKNKLQVEEQTILYYGQN